MEPKLYSYKNNYPMALPDRIRLSNGSTRTNPQTFTEEEIADAGYVLVKPIYFINPVTQRIIWDGTELKVSELTLEEKEALYNTQLENIRNKRNTLIKDTMWRIERYNSEIRLGLTPTDDIKKIDKYIQDLRDITKQPNIFDIVWPVLE